MRLKLISCDMFGRELAAAVSRSMNQVEVELLPKALHQFTDREVLRGLQSMIYDTDRSRYHAVLLVCGACQRSLTDLKAGSVPIVLPRAKDCISLLFERRQALPDGIARQSGRESSSTPKKVDHASGMERGHQALYWMAPARERSVSRPTGRFAADQARDWRIALGQSLAVRKRLAHPLHSCDRRAVCQFAGSVQARPRESLRPLSLLQLLVDGYWSYDDFLVVPVGWRVVAIGNTIRAEELPT